MGLDILKRVDHFVEHIENANFETELAFAKMIIGKEYGSEIDSLIQIIARAGERVMKVIITIDSDYDGYASARGLYYMVSLLGVLGENIELLPLTSLHSVEEVIEGENILLLISDTSFGNVKYKLNNSLIVWIDHHEINPLEIIRAKSAVGEDGVFINTKVSSEEYTRGLSCGAFIYILMNQLISSLDITGENEQFLTESYDRSVRLDAMLSLISDVMEIENYTGLIKGAYESHKTGLYELNKGTFDYSNKRYFRSYIAIINNLIRMERHDLLKKVLTENVMHDTVREIGMIEDDKKLIMRQYFRPCNPTHRINDDGRLIEFYSLPLSKNHIMRNFKGLLASIKTPKRGAFATFSYYLDKGEGYFSCRTNADLDIKMYIIQNGIKPLKMGGHLGAFGFVLKEGDLLPLVEALRTVRFGQRSLEGTVIKYKNINKEFKSVCNAALYNEFHSKEVSIYFEETDYNSISQEPKRTVYHIPSTQGENLNVISFELDEVKAELYAKPQLKKGLYDLNCIDIGEF